MDTGLLQFIYESPYRDFVKKCIQCGTCSGSCPTTWEHTPRKILEFIRAEIPEEPLKGDSVWMCTNCNTCGVRCPHQITMADLVGVLRSFLVEGGKIPKTIQDALMNMFRHGNPWGGLENKRRDWAKDLGVRDISTVKEVDVLYFVGCTPSYDVRGQEVARAMVKVFEKANVDFAILGNKEKCCGDSARRIGETGLFEFLVEENMSFFKKYSFRRIVTTSPHSFDVFSKYYPEDLRENIEIMHYTQFLAQLIDEGKIEFKGKIENGVVTYHDPCFLSKHNKVTEEPRKIIECIPGAELIEMKRVKENSFCCGGGGGRIWMEEPVKERPAYKRAIEAVSVKPNYIAVACPFCLMMLEDSVKVLGKEEIQVKDISELVSMSL